MRNKIAVFLLFLSGTLYVQDARAQLKTPEERAISLYTSVALQSYQPFWLASNRGGLYEEFSGMNGIGRLQASTSLQPEKNIDYAYGIDVVARGANDNSKLYLNQVYVSGKAAFFQLDIGRKYRYRGENPAALSSGSFALGHNTTPIPMVNISVPQFTPVPFTYQFIQFKGNLAHGWLDDDRYVKDTYLHEKSFYLQGGFDHWPVQGYAGMQHFVQWGGDSPTRGRLPSSFNDLASVFFGKGGGSDAPGGEQINALGNHLGIWDFGLKLYSRKFDYQVYWQHFFEDYSGLMFRNIGDGLWGASIQSKEKQLFSGIAYEVLYTKNQSGPGESDRPGNTPHCEEQNCGFKYGGRDNYYNNFIYRSGWTYLGRNLGNPLLMNVAQVQTYKPNFSTYNPAIESNRILAHHVGIKGQASSYLAYKAYITYVRHYGNYRGLAGGEPYDNSDPPADLEEYEFYPPLHQWNFMLETRWNLPQIPQLDLTSAIAWDTGDLTNNGGLQIGATWNF